jgi:hypothetical protein
LHHVKRGEQVVIEETSTWLKKWVDDTVGDQLAILGPPQAGERRTKGRGVALYLLDITPAPPNGVRRRRLEADVRYLITAWAAEPLDAHVLLSQLLFAALQNADLEVGVEPPPIDVWRGFGLPPQPAFLVRCRTWKDLTPRPVPRVTKRVFDVYVGVARQMSAAVSAHDSRPVNIGLAAAGSPLTVHLDRQQ